jgi:Holliday junction DNA helicase RuvB
VEDLARIIEQRALALKWQYADPGIFIQIAQRSKKSPRLGLNLLQMVYNVARSKNEDLITADHVREAFALSGIDSQGLDPLEQSYLQILGESQTLRLNILACRLGLPVRTIQDVVETFLVQEAFITKEGSERVLTEKGKKHITGLSV